MKRFVIAVSAIFMTCALAMPSAHLKKDSGYTQSIQVVNLLANVNLVDPGMTPTSIIIKYYNGAENPCWVTTLDYHQDTTIHAGPTQGCVQKVNEITITPMLVANKIKTYEGPQVVRIDISKYANQITVSQKSPPEFDPRSGLAAVSGTMQIHTQASLKS